MSDNALGLDLNLRVDYHTVPVHPGDVLFLSTDGIHDYVKDEAIASALGDGEGELDASCASLIDAASAGGSEDNLSCQIVVIESLDAEGEVVALNRRMRLVGKAVKASVDEVAGNRRSRPHCRAHQMGATAKALAPFKISIRSRGAVLTIAEFIGIHRQAH